MQAKLHAMRATVLFFLVASILALTYWAWNLTSLRLEYFHFRDADKLHEQMDKINSLSDIQSLRDHAMSLLQNIDEKAIERDMVTMKASNVLLLTMFIGIIAQIVLFYEIAARGKDNKQQST